MVVARAQILCLLIVQLVYLDNAYTLPPRLLPGDTVGLVSLASPPCQLTLPFSCPDGFINHVEEGLAQFSLKTVWGSNVWAVDTYLAGTDQQRAEDLMKMFADPNVKAIISTRGGDGSARILPLLDFDVICANPKIVMGYSDITVILNAIHQKCNFLTFHGQLGCDDFESNGKFWKALLMDALTPTLKFDASLNDPPLPVPYTITPGTASGKLIGGCLSLVTNILGSEYAPLSAFEGAILFLEDVHEPPVKIDRYLTQLDLFGVLDVVAGVVFGQCSSCTTKEPSFSLKQVLQYHLGNRGIPVFANAMFGHIHTYFTLPVGANVIIDATNLTIYINGPVVG